MPDPFVIAEMGSTHDAEFAKASHLIRVAKDAGADAVKTQWWSDSAKVAARMHASEHEAVLERVRFPAAWLPQLSDEAHGLGLEFLCTVDLEEDIAVVAPYVDRFKIASWGAGDSEFFRAHLAHEKPIVISFGVAEASDLPWEGINAPARWRTFLHCVSAYPAPMDQLNLRVIRQYALHGFSDHTRDIRTGALAVAAGARVLEVHYMLPDTSADNPDRVVSLLPWQLKEYIANARLAWRAMGDGVKRIMPCEEKYLRHRYV